MTKLLINDWISNPSIQLISVITNDDSDRYYHDHNFFEIFYILDGSITHHLNGKKEVLQTGDAFLLRPTDQHGFIRESGVPCAHRDIIISEQLLRKTCDFVDPEAFDKLVKRKEPLKTRLTKSKIIDFEKEFSKLFFAPADQGGYTKKTIANVLSVSLLNLFLQESQTDFDGLPIWLNNILPEFSAPISMRLGLNFILKDVGYDKSYVCRTFKKYMGCTMTDYLRNQRIDYATSLLLTTDKSIPEICEEIGIDSVSYFITAFKQRHSLSPKQFKKNFAINKKSATPTNLKK